MLKRSVKLPIGPVTQRIYDTITGIQLGKIEGPEGWSVEVK